MLGFWLAFLLGLGGLRAQTQLAVTEGPLQKKHMHERFLRLVRGGDGNYYAFKGNAGHYWQFASEGERGLQIIRLDARMEPQDTMKIKRFGDADQLKNVLEVLVAPDGIAVLNLAKEPVTGIPVLRLCRPDFAHSPTRFRCEKLADMPGLAIGIDQPALRVAYSPDSSTILLAWRRLPKDIGSDRSLCCMILNKKLEILRPPFSPFKQFDLDVFLKDALILDEDHLLFTAQTVQHGNALSGPGTISYGILHYAVGDAELRVIKFTSGKVVPVETRLGIDRAGNLIASGWYIDQSTDQRLAGVFMGKITGADSLEHLHLEPFDPALRDALIRREMRSGAVGIRTGFHSALLSSETGYCFVLHLRGEVDPGLTPRAPGNKANNTLHCFRFDGSLEFLEHSMTGFQNMGREEYYESFSWRPLLIDGAWHALATDYSRVRHAASPIEASTYAWGLPAGNFEMIHANSAKPFTILAPREIVKVSEHEWVAMAISANRWRLLRMTKLD